MKKAASLAFLFACLSGGIQLSGQNNEKYYSAALHGHYGFIIPHSNKIAGFAGTNPIGISLKLSRINISQESWQTFNAFWFSGIEAGNYNFSNRSVLGSAVTLAFFAEPVLSHGRNHLLTIKGGMGPVYLTTLFDSINNPSNLFFSTRMAFILNLSATFSYRVSQNLFLNISGNYNHISNGGVRQPNLGMNFPTLSAGVQYSRRGMPEFSRQYVNDIEIKRGLTWTIQALSGYRVVDKTENYPEKGTFAFGLNSRASKQLTRYYAISAGAEVIFDGAIRETIRRSGRDVDYKRAAVTIGQDFLFGKAVFTQYFGIYIYSPYKARNSTYQKYELSFRLSDNVFMGFFLKAHAYYAELMGLHLGLTL